MARCPACLSLGIALQHEAKGTGCGHCCCFSSSVLVKTRGLSELFVKRWETPQSPSEQGSPKARSPTLLGPLQGMKCGSAPLHKPHSSPPPPPPLQPRGSSDPAPVSASWNFPAEKKKKTPAENSHSARVVPAVTSHCHPASFPGGLWFVFAGRCPPRPFSPPSSAPGAPGCIQGYRSLAADTAQLDERDTLPFLSQNPAGSGAGSVPSGAVEPWVLQCHRHGCRAAQVMSSLGCLGTSVFNAAPSSFGYHLRAHHRNAVNPATMF